MVESIAVIGCGAAGATAALQARKFNRKVGISLFNTEEYSQYSRCGLPYTISGKVGTFEDLVLMAPDNWSALKIDANLGVTVTDIDHKAKELTYSGGKQSYDALIFATGAENADPPIKGLDKKRVYGLRTLDDAKALAAEADKAKKAVIIGGGLVGMDRTHTAGCQHLTCRALGLHVEDPAAGVLYDLADCFDACEVQVLCHVRNAVNVGVVDIR